MKVAYVTPFYSGESDGRYGRFHDWVHTLRDMEDPPFDFEVHALVATDPDSTLVSEPAGYLGDGDELWGTKRNTFEFLLNAPRLRRDLLRSDADVVHVLTVDTVLTPLVRSVARSRSRPCVLGPNVGGWFPLRDGPSWATSGPGRMKQWAKFYLRKGLVRCSGYDRLLVFSEYHRGMLEQLGVPSDEITVLTAGVSPPFHPETRPVSNDPPELLYVGDLSAHKGFGILLDALERVEQPATVRVIGSGEPPADRMARPDRELVFEGFVERHQLPEYYRRADLCVIPSIDETAGPNTQIEALACGTPVVVTDRPSMNEYAPDGAATYFWPRDAASLAVAITGALQNLQSATRVAQTNAASFQAATTVAQLADVYRTVCEGATHRSR
jgi:glycosyltransferase involved in cell wall biosynthesis